MTEEDLDRQLVKLATAKTPPMLDNIDGVVLERVAGHRFANSESLFRIGSLAALVALTMGIVGGVVPNTADQNIVMSPLLGTSELAPSALLIGNR